MSGIVCSALDVELRPCHENRRCVETWTSLHNQTRFSEMILSSTVRESAISCGFIRALANTYYHEQIDFGNGQIMFGNIQTNSVESCVDNRHPALGLSYSTEYTLNRTGPILDSYLVTPTRFIIDSDGTIEEYGVCNPSSAPMSYTSNIADNGSWVIRSSLSFNDEAPRVEGDELFNYTVTSSYVLDTSSRFSTISGEDYGELIQRISDTSGALFTEMEDGSFGLVNCHTHLPQLPSVSFTTFTGDSTPVLRFVVYPEDYMTRDCVLTFRPVAENQRRIIGDNILRLFTVHFDQVRRKIGFCDPQ